MAHTPTLAIHDNNAGPIHRSGPMMSAVVLAHDVSNTLQVAELDFSIFSEFLMRF